MQNLFRNTDVSVLSQILKDNVEMFTQDELIDILKDKLDRIKSIDKFSITSDKSSTTLKKSYTKPYITLNKFSNKSSTNKFSNKSSTNKFSNKSSTTSDNFYSKPVNNFDNDFNKISNRFYIKFINTNDLYELYREDYIGIKQYDMKQPRFFTPVKIELPRLYFKSARDDEPYIKSMPHGTNLSFLNKYCYDYENMKTRMDVHRNALLTYVEENRK